MVALAVSAVSAGLLLCLALVARFVFPRVPSVGWWALSWTLAALAWLETAASPWFTAVALGPLEWALRHLFILSSFYALSLGFHLWYPHRRRPLWIPTAGFVVAGVPLAFGWPDPASGWSWLVAALGAAVLVGSSFVVAALDGYRDGRGASKVQAQGFLGALTFGVFPFAVTWVVFTALPHLGWSVGFPPFLVLAAGLQLWGLHRHDLRLTQRTAAPFVVERTQDAVLFLQAEGRVHAVNPAFRLLFDLDEEKVVGRTLTSLAADADTAELLEPLQRLVPTDWEGTLALAHRTGRPLPVHVVFRRIHNPAREAVGAVLLLYDMRVPQHLDLTSREDLLTSLANRRWVLELLEAEVQRVKRYGGELSALWITVDHLEDVRSRFGAEAADEVLRRLGAILRGGLRKTDFCGRVGPRDFLAVLPETPTERGHLVAGRLAKMFALASEGEPTGAALRIGAAGLDEGSGSAEAFLTRVHEAVPVGSVPL